MIITIYVKPLKSKEMEAKKTTAEKLQEVILDKTLNNLTPKEEPKKEVSSEEKKAPKTKASNSPAKAKAKRETKKAAEASLVEEVISKREVKYIYPEDCQDTLSRKTFRQKVRNQLHKLELEMLRIEDKNSKEYKAKAKEYKQYRSQYVKDGAAA